MYTSKNALQELRQKKRLPLPYYDSWVDGPSHAPVWQAAVTLDDRTFPGEPAPTKTAAEISAAAKALKALREEQKALRTDASGHEVKIAIIIDLENLPNMPAALIERLDLSSPTTIDVIAFVGERHPARTKVWEGISTVVVHSFQVDAVDSAIQVYVGATLSRGVFDLYILATMDRFGQSLRDAVRRPSTVQINGVDTGLWEERPMVVTSNVDEIVSAATKPLLYIGPT